MLILCYKLFIGAFSDWQLYIAIPEAIKEKKLFKKCQVNVRNKQGMLL